MKILGNDWLLKHDKNMQGCGYDCFLVVFMQALSLHNFKGDHRHTYFSEWKINKLIKMGK